MPSQKVGMHWPDSANVIAQLSRSELRRRADRMPSGTASSMASSIAARASLSVAGKRSSTSGRVGCWWRSERPKSARTARARKRPY